MQLVVADNGPGVPPAPPSAIFEPFVPGCGAPFALALPAAPR